MRGVNAASVAAQRYLQGDHEVKLQLGYKLSRQNEGFLGPWSILLGAQRRIATICSNVCRVWILFQCITSAS